MSPLKHNIYSLFFHTVKWINIFTNLGQRDQRKTATGVYCLQIKHALSVGLLCKMLSKKIVKHSKMLAHLIYFEVSAMDCKMCFEGIATRAVILKTCHIAQKDSHIKNS